MGLKNLILFWFPFPLKGNRACNYMAFKQYYIIYDFDLIFKRLQYIFIMYVKERRNIMFVVGII